MIDIFLASNLIYATKFYPIPENMQTIMRRAISDYVNYPSKIKTIAQSEMWKTKENGGIKLVNIAIKSATSKAKWLLEIATNEKLLTNLLIFTRLVGKQEGEIIGRDLIFLQKSYFKNKMDCNKFYKEGLLAIGNLTIRKGIPTLNHWDDEHIFFNPLFTTQDGKTLKLRKYCNERNIFRYDQLIEEKRKELAHLPFDKVQTNLLDKILVSTLTHKEDILITSKEKKIKLKDITQKLLDEETLLKVNSHDHHSQAKLIRKLNTVINWDNLWNTVHNTLSTNKTKTVIWQQIHLNFYTQYSYNKWHKTQKECPLCLKIPKDIFHMMINCDFVNALWKIMEPTLVQLHPVPTSEEEMILGIVRKKHTIGSLLRNWITFLLRETIMEEEKLSYYAATKPNVRNVMRKFVNHLRSELYMKSLRYEHENRLSFFEKIFTYKDVLCKKEVNGKYKILL